MTTQLSIPLPHLQSFTRENLFVAEPNAAAFSQVIAPDLWGGRKLMLVGPKASGKSHMSQIFATETAAQVIGAETLGDDLTPPQSPIVVVEDAHRLKPEGQEALFHLHNALAQTGLLLITARSAPRDWGLTLPDLISRMEATPIARIAPPDDSLLQALIFKHFHDRQIRPPLALVSYLLPRVERSYAGVAEIVARLDAESLARGERLSLPLARQILEETS